MFAYNVLIALFIMGTACFARHGGGFMIARRRSKMARVKALVELDRLRTNHITCYHENIVIEYNTCEAEKPVYSLTYGSMNRCKSCPNRLTGGGQTYQYNSFIVTFVWLCIVYVYTFVSMQLHTIE